MKIDKIRKLILEQKGVTILTGQQGQQWIGGRDWMVRVDEGLRLTADSIKGLFDFSVEQMEKITVVEGPLENSPLWFVERRGTNTMQPGPLNIDNYGGIEMLIFSGAVYLAEQKYIRCAVSREDYRDYELAWDKQGNPLIIVMDGLIFAGIFRPLPESACKMLLEQMRFMVALQPGGTGMDGEPAEEPEDGEQLDMEGI